MWDAEVLENRNGVTVKELKEFIKDWPEEGENGEPTEVWMTTGAHTSSPVKAVWPLNKRTRDYSDSKYADILFE